MRPEPRPSAEFNWEDYRRYEMAGAAVFLTSLAVVGLLVLIGVAPLEALGLAPIAILAVMVMVFLPVLWLQIIWACADELRWRRRWREGK